MKIVSWKNENKPKGYDWTIQTDCKVDNGIESAYDKISSILAKHDGKIVPEEVDKLVKSLKARWTGPKAKYSRKNGWSSPTEKDEDIYAKRLALRAAEYYCMGKLMTGENENKYQTSGIWDPLKEFFTDDFDWFNKVRERIFEYYTFMADSNAHLQADPLVAIHEPIAIGAHSDRTKRNAFKWDYVNDKYKQDSEAAKQKFEDEVAAADISLYKATPKDKERVEDLYRFKGGMYDKAKANRMLALTKDMNKIIARFIYSVALPEADQPIWEFAEKALDEGAITKTQLEALTRKLTGKSLYSPELNYDGNSKLKVNIKDLDESIFDAILEESIINLGKTPSKETLEESKAAAKEVIRETCENWAKVAKVDVDTTSKAIFESLIK